MNAIDKVRALFVPGGQVRCVDNTYHRSAGQIQYIGRVWTVAEVGKSVWKPVEAGWRGTFPTRVRDVIAVGPDRATWLLGRGDHTVTYERVS